MLQQRTSTVGESLVQLTSMYKLL